MEREPRLPAWLAVVLLFAGALLVVGCLVGGIVTVLTYGPRLVLGD